MTLTISLNPDIFKALSDEASARNITCEETVCELLENYFAFRNIPDPDYDEWFRARYEEGIAAYERGDFCTNDDVKKDVAERRAKFLAQIEGK